MLGVADSLEQQAGQTAPGAAPLLTAQAQVANLQNQAYLQKMLAAELRQEATRLAHDNAMLKSGAAANRNLRNNMQQILSRP
jgi:tRNA A37 threonylcarbamoyltransferase TsaD